MVLRLCKPNLCARTLKFYCTNTTSPVEVPKKSLQQKWKELMKALVSDYKDVFIDFAKHMREHPIKSGLWLSLCASLLTCQSLNPSEQNFKAKVVEKSNELIFVGKPVRNPEAEQHLELIACCFNQDQILRLSFGLFSVILRNFKSSRCDSFKENCAYIQPLYVEIIRDHVIDIGFFNKWWILDRKMTDFDINPGEWKNNKE